MIPAIGMMIGAYIVTRMLELMVNPDSKTVVKVFAVITIVVTIISQIDILNAGSSIPRL